MSKTRRVEKVLSATPTLEGAGVRLKRAFGYHQVPLFDPFLMLDHFESSHPADYEAGFPWHPHRGIETISYILDGAVEHGDSMGNKGVIGAGDVQWMTAGSGIIHQEMPKGDRGGRMRGFQLWANLPARHKMMPPRYQEITARQIPEVSLPNGGVVRLVCGKLNGLEGPVRDIVTNPEFLDVTLPPGAAFHHPIPAAHSVFAYVFEGEARFDTETLSPTGVAHVVLIGKGTDVSVSAGSDGVRFLLISGQPLGEPVAWRGPIVMNTDEELATAFDEFEKGTFLKYVSP